MARLVQKRHSIQFYGISPMDALLEVSMSLGKGLTAEGIKGKWVKGNLYGIKFADPGAGKSDSIDDMHRAAKQYEDNKQRYWEELMRGDALADVDLLEGEIAFLKAYKKMDRDIRKKKLAEARTKLLLVEPRTHRPEIYLDKITPEAVRERLFYNGGCLYSVSDEGTGITNIILGGKFNNGKEDSAEFRTGYSWGEIKSSLKNQDTKKIDAACITVNWSMTNGDGTRLLAIPEFQKSGLASRFIYLMDKSEKQEVSAEDDRERTAAERVESDTIESAWKRLIWDLLNEYRYGKPQQVKYTAEAKTAMLDYHNYLVRKEVGPWRNIKDFITRSQENAWRISLVLHAMKWGAKAHLNEIDVETAHAAKRASEFFIEQALSMVHVQRVTEENKDWKNVCTLAARMNGGFKLRDAQRAEAAIKLSPMAHEIERKLKDFVDAASDSPRLITVTIKKGESPWYVPFEHRFLRKFHDFHKIVNPYGVRGDADERRAA